MIDPNRKAIRQGLAWGTGGKFLLMLSNLLTLMVTSRLLGAAEFGIYAMALVFADFCIGFANSTLGTTLVTRKNLDEDGLKAGFASFLILSILLAGFIGLGAEHWSRLVGMPDMAPVLRVVVLVLPLRFISSYLGAILMREMELKTHQISQSFPQILGGVATILGAISGLGVWCLVVGVLVASLAEFIFLFCRTKAPMGLPSSFKPVLDLFGSSAGISASRVISFFAANVDRVLVGGQIGAEALGVYSRAFGLMMVPFKLFGVTFGRVFLSAFSRIKPQDPAFASLMSRILAVQGIVYIPASVGLFLTADILVRLILGPNWAEAIPLAQFLFAAMFARMGYEVCENILFAAGEAWLVTVRQICLFLLLLTFCIAGFSLNGLIGVAAGVSSAFIVYYILSLIQIVRLFLGDWALVIKGHVIGLAIAFSCAALTIMLWKLATGVFFPTELTGKILWPTIYWSLVLGVLLGLPESVCGEEIANMRKRFLRRAE